MSHLICDNPPSCPNIPPGSCSTTMASPGASIFPIEIYEEIISAVPTTALWRVETKTLLNCALTCRAWVPQSQRSLYFCIKLWMVEETGPAGLARIQRLAQGLRRSSTLRASVRDLEIIEIFPGNLAVNMPDTYYPRKPYAARVLHIGTILAAGFLPHLHTLTFGTTNVHHHPMLPLAFHRSSFACLKHLPALVTLRLIRMSIFFSDFCKFLHGVPSLRELVLRRIVWVTPWPPADTGLLNELPKIEVLSICERRSETVPLNIQPHWMLLCAFGQTLKALTLDVESLYRLPLLGTFWLEGRHQSAQIQFPKLRSLSIFMYFITTTGGGGHMFFLEHAHLPRLENMQIVNKHFARLPFTGEKVVDPMVDFGEEIDTYAAQLPCLRLLKAISFIDVEDYFGAIGDERELLPFICSHLPLARLGQWRSSSRLYRRGALQYAIAVYRWDWVISAHEFGTKIWFWKLESNPDGRGLRIRLLRYIFRGNPSTMINSGSAPPSSACIGTSCIF
ncbi:hypothetical protein C8T65DRAFT_648636, partial [Cerioporus squamosus]